MNADQIGKKLVSLCREGKNLESVNTLYADDIMSVEAAEMPGGARIVQGIEGVRGKNQWWLDNHVVHSAEAHGPYPHGSDRFAVRFVYDVTHKPNGARMSMDEIAVFTVKDGKIAREEFFYSMGG